MSTVTSAPILLPGDAIPAELIPQGQKRRLGHGIHVSASPAKATASSTPLMTASSTGPLYTDFKRKTALISTPTARYIPRPGDLVLVQVQRTSQDFFHVSLTAGANSQTAILGHLSFEGATKKSRPQLKQGDVVYGKIVFCQKNMEIEISCVNPSTGKAAPDGLGPMKGGMVFDVSVGFCHRLLRKEGLGVLMEELGGKIKGGFEIAVGLNGRVWVDVPDSTTADGTRHIVAIGCCLRECDQAGLKESEQKKLVSRVCRAMSVG